MRLTRLLDDLLDLSVLENGSVQLNLGLANLGLIIDRALAEDDVDPERVYVMGVSKGGMLTYRIAAELAPRLAGFCTVLASMPVAATCP